MSRVHELLSRLDGVDGSNGQWKAKCPHHEDNVASLSISETSDGKILLKCHAGCSTANVVHSVGMTMAALFPEKFKPPKSAKPKSRVVATYTYTDEQGQPLYRVKRLEPKSFPQEHYDNGKWKNGRGPTKATPVPYRLPELLKSSGVVYIPEGEKHVNRLIELGFNATCNDSGGGKWRDDLSKYLDGRDVIILPDNDSTGRKHRDVVGESITSHAASVRVLDLPGLPEKGDIIDWLDAGHTADELRKLSEGAVDWEPPKESRTIANCKVIKTDEGEFVEPFPMSQILGDIHTFTDGWPKRVGNVPFVPGVESNTVSWVEKSSALMGWLGTATGMPPRIRGSVGCHTKEDIFEELRRTCKSYLSVEHFPHEPPMENHYYLCNFPEPGDGSTLNSLVERYCPETNIDSDLIKAAFVTPFWGGPGGFRPSLLITSDAGRGAGKTTLASHVGLLAGGTLDLSSGEDASQIKQRLLSPDGWTKRVVTLDNVKTNKFSWADFEALVTAPTISGKRMYTGESVRPNNLLWTITLNGASLSKDIAQRCVIIKLRKPNRSSGTWAEETRQFIENNRTALVADCIGFLRSERYSLSQYTRWASWERDVLERLPDPSEAQRVIVERQKAADVDDEESQVVEDYFRTQLSGLSYDPETERIFIPSTIACTWTCTATNDRKTTAATSRMLNQWIDEGTMTCLTKNRCRSWGRGFVWYGPGSHPENNVRTNIEQMIEIGNQRKWGN